MCLKGSSSRMPEFSILILTIGLALVYAYANGMNDAANAIAAVISTRVLTPGAAVLMSGSLNALGAFTGLAVAKTIGKGIIEPQLMTQYAVISAIGASVIWVFVATRWGYPVSVSHSLIAGVVGAGVAVAGFQGLEMAIVIKVLLALAFSPILGFGGGFLFMVGLYWLLRRRSPAAISSVSTKLQLVAAAFLSYSHGKNDGQNAIGIIALAWAVHYSQDLTIETWMIFISALTIGLGTAIGGMRVIRTLGMRVTRLEPISGFAANATAAAIIEMASNLALPVSTTHTASSTIMGVGATRRLSAVRWGVTRSIMLAWVVTYPFCLVLGWTLAKVLTLLF
jgi:PiT family inorganic phosphate transporter